MDDVAGRVRKVLGASLPSGVITENIDDEFPLVELGVGIDSVARLELLVALEQEFRMRLDEEEITPLFFESVGNMARHIKFKLGAASA
jgi:acyl carrier protein